ncbi:MAG: helix-hairpin-helix domain-containing protein, partial [Halobacteriales archaeon]
GSATEGSREAVDSLSGIGPAYSERLNDAGIETVGDLAAADAPTLDEATGIGEGRLEEWVERASSR